MYKTSLCINFEYNPASFGPLKFFSHSLQISDFVIDFEINHIYVADEVIDQIFWSQSGRSLALVVLYSDWRPQWVRFQFYFYFNSHFSSRSAFSEQHISWCSTGWSTDKSAGWFPFQANWLRARVNRSRGLRESLEVKMVMIYQSKMLVIIMIIKIIMIIIISVWSSLVSFW